MTEAENMRYLVHASQGPGFATPEETVHVLERIIIPGFDASRGERLWNARS